MSKDIDSKIIELFQVLSKQKEDLENTKKEIDRKWETNCSLQFGNESPVNVQTASEDVLHTALARLICQKEYNIKASTELGLPVSTKINGFEFDNWVNDFKKRIAAIQINSKKKKIQELETRLNAIISPEQKRQLELEAITKALIE